MNAHERIQCLSAAIGLTASVGEFRLLFSAQLGREVTAEEAKEALEWAKQKRMKKSKRMKVWKSFQ
jgi:hypothetical protein